MSYLNWKVGFRKMVDNYLEERNVKFTQEHTERALMLENVFGILESEDLSQEEFVQLLDFVIKLSDWREE